MLCHAAVHRDLFVLFSLQCESQVEVLTLGLGPSKTFTPASLLAADKCCLEAGEDDRLGTMRLVEFSAG